MSKGVFISSPGKYLAHVPTKRLQDLFHRGTVWRIDGQKKLRVVLMVMGLSVCRDKWNSTIAFVRGAQTATNSNDFTTVYVKVVYGPVKNLIIIMTER